MKVALGTVQFGTDYGAFGDPAQVSRSQARQILSLAHAAGIDTLDTAAAYGDAEIVLGDLEASRQFRVVTKVPSLSDEPEPSIAIEASIDRSLNDLKVGQLDGLMFHRASDLLGPNGFTNWQTVDAARDLGKVGLVGVSVYSPEEALAVLDRYPITLIQLPFNVFDQRALQSGLFDILVARGVEIHVRSALLQGFAVSQPDALPVNLARHAPALARFQRQAADAGLTQLEAAIGFALAQEQIARVVVGVRTADELSEILDAAKARWPSLDLSSCASDDQTLINPSFWAAHA